MSGWTKEPGGDFVDWTKPPYHDGNGPTLVLEHEKPELVTHDVRCERITEYYRLLFGRRHSRR